MLAVERRRARAAVHVPVQELVQALLEGDEDDAREQVASVLADTGSRTAVFADLLQPAQTEIGDLWYLGRVSYADEVRAAAMVERLVGSLPPTPVPRLVPQGSRCILGVPQGDPHQLGLRMFALALQDHGWRTEVLDASHSADALAEIVVRHRPRFFGLSAGLVARSPELEAAVAGIRQARIPVLFGGVAFGRSSELCRRFAVEGLGTDARIGVVLAQRTLLEWPS
ncbi:MAG: cobalamin-dependent protein [Candidatus Dormibacteraeota bacterium]|nr:cobalamin-dependent protein [Candidatus Dormibacteraeota bacterium]